jgi:1-acyl-sn-glycerol-3-phosphate acyltransferase
MGGVTETTWPTRVGRTLRLILALGRTYGAACRHGRVAGSVPWRRVVERGSRSLLDAVAVEIRVRGARPLLSGPVMLVANHVSWLDVQALGAIAGTRFVAKSEVRSWPVVGGLAARLGTLFIRRGHRRDAMRVKNALARLLVTGERVAVFPEGTTTDGDRLGPFHAALLQAAIDAAVPVQPVAIRHRELDGRPSAAAAFVDDMTFATSLGRVLARPRLVVELTFGPPFWAADQTRRQLAARCRGFIANTLGLAEPTSIPVAAPTVRRAA